MDSMEKNWKKQIHQKWRIYCDGKPELNVSVIMNHHQGFSIAVSSIDKTTMDV